MNTTRQSTRGVVGNERLTAWAGAVLLVLLAAELASTIRLRSFMPAHVFVGVLLLGPLAVKLGTTGYRFVRYYTGSVVYVRRGPPRLALRVLAVAFVPTTLVLVGSGGGLLLTGPAQPGSLIAVHNISTLIWLPMFAIHAVAYVRRLPGLVAGDVRREAVASRLASGLRLLGTVGAITAGAIAAALILPSDAPWIGWAQTNEQAPAPLIVGTILSLIVLIAVRPLRWTADQRADESRDIHQR